MLDLIEAMSKKVDAEQQRIDPIRQQLYDQQNFGDLQGDELAEAKQDKIDSDLEAAKEKQSEKAAKRLAWIESVLERASIDSLRQSHVALIFVSRPPRNSISIPRKRRPSPHRPNRSTTSAAIYCGT